MCCVNSPNVHSHRETFARQRALYKALLANVSVADLLEKAANIGDADSARSLMNLDMQFRKVSKLYPLPHVPESTDNFRRFVTILSCSSAPMSSHPSHSPSTANLVP